MKYYFSINHKWLLTAFCFIIICSCKKLVEIPPSPSNQISEERVFTDSADIMSAVSGIYALIQNVDVVSYTGLSSDELSTSSQSYIQFYNNSIAPNNSLAWNGFYANIYTMNACLAGIGSTQAISLDLKNRLIGEIKAIRALYYFTLVNIWGGVPLITTTDYKENAALPRSSVDSVYGLIMDDLADARQKLGVTYPSAGHVRPNLYSASALLAKVCLYKSQWDSASNLANSVINSGLYRLEPDLNKVFLDGSAEAVWQVPSVNTSYQTNEGKTFIPYSNTIIPSYQITPYLMSAFETGDNRKADWLGINRVTTNGSVTIYYYPYKYKNANNSNVSTTEDFMIVRLSELYLIRAEAFAHENKLDSAMADLNIVRNRAGLSNSTASGQTEILNAIMHERQVELLCEWNSRWFDLKRTGSVDATLGREKQWWQPYDALYPILLTEILSNPFLIQNMGY